MGFRSVRNTACFCVAFSAALIAAGQANGTVVVTDHSVGVGTWRIAIGEGAFAIGTPVPLPIRSIVVYDPSPPTPPYQGADTLAFQPIPLADAETFTLIGSTNPFNITSGGSLVGQAALTFTGVIEFQNGSGGEAPIYGPDGLQGIEPVLALSRLTVDAYLNGALATSQTVSLAEAIPILNPLIHCDGQNPSCVPVPDFNLQSLASLFIRTPVLGPNDFGLRPEDFAEPLVGATFPSVLLSIPEPSSALLLWSGLLTLSLYCSSMHRYAAKD